MRIDWVGMVVVVVALSALTILAVSHPEKTEVVSGLVGAVGVLVASFRGRLIEQTPNPPPLPHDMH